MYTAFEMADHYDMPAGGLPDGSMAPPGTGMPAGAPQAPGGPGAGARDTYHATISCTIDIEVQASSSAEANEEILRRTQLMMNQMGGLNGVTPRVIVVVDPETGIAVEAFLDRLREA